MRGGEFFAPFKRRWGSMDQVRALEMLGHVADRYPAAVGEGLAELVEAIPSGAPPELVVLTASAAVLPEKPRLAPDMRGLVRGAAKAWLGKDVESDEESLEVMWQLLEFSAFALTGRGFREWAAYRTATEEAERKLAEDARAAQNYAWAYKHGLIRFFAHLFKEAPEGS